MKTITLYLSLAFSLTLIVGSFTSAQSERKVIYGLLLDNSGSLRLQLPQVRAIGKEVVKRTYQRGSITVFSFVRQGDLAVVSSNIESSQDKDVLDKYIDHVAVTAGRTTLLDSIGSIAEKINLEAGSEKGTGAEKIIILITDGEDRMSSNRESDLVKQLRENGFKIYAVGLVQDLDDKDGLIRRSPKAKAIDLLTTLTKETGGRVVFPKSKQTNVESLLSELLTP